MERQWKRKLSPGEREKHDSLTTETEREAFRIIRNWSQTDSGDSDFYVHCRTLGERLGITLQGAADIRRRFCSSGILRKTAESSRIRRLPGPSGLPATSQKENSPRSACRDEKFR